MDELQPQEKEIVVITYPLQYLLHGSKRYSYEEEQVKIPVFIEVYLEGILLTDRGVNPTDDFRELKETKGAGTE